MKKFLVITFSLFVVSRCLASLYWRTTTDEDFSTGTSSNIVILGSGENAYLALSTNPYLVGWWNRNWKYKRPVYVWNHSDRILTDYQVSLVVNTRDLILSGKMKSDCSDIRFIGSDETTILSYWIESGVNTSSTTIWVKVSTIPANSYATIYMYYGNTSASSVSNPYTTFLVYENFNTDPTNRWSIFRTGTNAGVWNSTEGVFYLTQMNLTNTASAIIARGVSLPDSWRATFRYKVTNNSGVQRLDGHEGFVFMFYKSSTGYTTPDYGNRLGFTSGNFVVPGYGVEFDALADGVDGNQNGHIALIKDNPLQSHLTYYPIQNTWRVTSEQWEDVDVKFITWQTSSTLWVSVAGGPVINYTGSFDFTYRGVGFCGATGSAGNGNAHIIDDVIIRKANTVEPACSIGDEMEPPLLYYPSGVYYSDWLSTSVVVNYNGNVTTVTLNCIVTKVDWNVELLPNTTAEMYILTAGETEWRKVQKGQQLNLFGNAFKYGIILYSDGLNTPKLHEINIEYKTVPVTIFSISTFTGTYYETVFFDASASFDIDGKIEYYLWDFGDGEVGWGVNPVHTYAPVSTTTTYKILLVTIDNDGLSSRYYQTITYYPFSLLPPVVIYSPPSVAKAKVDKDLIYINDKIVLDGSQSYINPEEDIKVAWAYAPYGNDDWYTGSWTLINSPGPISTNLVTEHYFMAPGDYTVGLMFFNINDEIFSTDTVKVTVVDFPKAVITSLNQIISDNKIVVGYGENIILDATKSKGYSITSYFWDLGDGNTSTSSVLTHTYPSITSSYTVRLTVEAYEGKKDTTEIKVIVSARPVALAKFKFIALEGEILVFDATDSYDPDGEIVMYSWDFGDGRRATGARIEHFYSKSGNYKVVLGVTDNVGLKHYYEHEIVVLGSSSLSDADKYWFKKEELNVYPLPCKVGQQNVKFRYYLDEDSEVYLAIFDLTGRMIKNFSFPASVIGSSKGWNEIEWDCRDNFNELVGSGTYIAKMVAIVGSKKIYKTQKIALYRVK